MGWNSIQGKLIGLVVAGCLVLALVGIWGGVEQEGVIKRMEYVLHHKSEVNESVDHLNVVFKAQVQEWKNVLLRGSNPSDGQKYWQAFTEQHKKFEAKVEEAVKLLDDDPLAKDLRNLSTLHSALLPKYEEGRRAFEQAGFDAKVGDSAVKGIDRELSQKIDALADMLNASMEKDTQALSAAAGAIYGRTLVVELVLTALVVFAVVVSVKSQVLNPLAQVIDHIRRLAEGDYTRSLAAVREDELGALFNNVEKLRGALCSMIGGGRSTAMVLTQVNEQLNQSSIGLDRDTAKTEGYAGQIATAINEMVSTVSEVAKNASQAADATVLAETRLHEGNQIMSGAISAITRVADEVAQTSEQMNRLKEESTSVGAVLDVIKGIAEQTNLLALNAAIEAARAGEQGRGFAVVADEVRALAKRTQESTEEIQQIIKALQDGASSAAQAMLQSTGKTRDSVAQAENAGRTMSDISGAIGLIRDMTHQIAAAAQEQSHAADEINRNVVSMASLAENAHAHARKTGAVTQGLDQTAKDLQSMVAGFRL
ncbi:MAG TPA: methyl-accepting chemotaxis protein [Marinagarivorans sp.]|nr:methyl-accepting chemotaxis protein [Marinagarivorans sp.]